MDNYFHKACIRVFAKEGEDYEKIRQKLLSFFPFDPEAEKVQVEQHTSEGFRDREIRTYEICISKKRHLRLFFEHLMEKIGAQKEILIRQKESRLDDEQKFYIRFDKAKLMQDNKYIITDSGICFHLTLSIAVFPTKRETALALIDKIFK